MLEIDKEELKKLIREIVNEVLTEKLKEHHEVETSPCVQPLHIDFTDSHTNIWC